MKKAITSLTVIVPCLLFFAMNIAAQVPGYFNYQAVIKDADHNPVTGKEISMKFTITQDSESGTEVYSEIHNLTPGDDGMISVMVGNGGQPSGNIHDIDWGNHSYFLEVGIDPDNGTDFTSMGSRQLVAVPYAMHAGTVDMPQQNMEIMEPENQDPEAALFEVKRADGSTVFAVYNEGVRIYVDDSDGTGPREGFTVGGYNTDAQGYSNEYFRVTPDSVRVYINQDNAKSVKGGFAVGGYKSGKELPFEYMHLTPENYFIGYDAGVSNTTGRDNTFLGSGSGASNTTGSNNIFLGQGSGHANTSGGNNIFLGNWAGGNSDTASLNVFIGNMSGYWNTGGKENIFIGNQTGHMNATGYANTMIGGVSGYHNNGDFNTFVGQWSGNENVSGNNNVFIGVGSGAKNHSGSSNTFLGPGAGNDNESGNNNVFIGKEAGYFEMGSNKLYIENSAADSATALIYGDFEADRLGLNAVVHVREFMELQPIYYVPQDPSPGTVYFDGNDNTLKAWDGTTWHSLW